MKRILIFSTIASLATVLATVAPAHAQFGNPAGMSPDTPRMDTANPPADHANTQDKLFVRQAAIGGHAEVELSKLAQQKGSATAVKEFAKRMVDDHSKSNDQLGKVGRGINPQAPKDLDPEHKTIRAELDKLSGAEFDAAYLTSQIQDHQKTANLLLWEVSFGQNEPLKKQAATMLPVVLDHLEAAKQAFAQLTASPPPR